MPMICALVFVLPNDGINTLCQEIRNNFNADADKFLRTHTLVALDKMHLAVFRCFQ